MHEQAPVATVVAFSAFEVDLHTGELRKHGIRIKLQDQPFQILVMLLEHPGELVTRDQIKAQLWPSETFVDFDHSMNTAIRRLREALSDSAETPRFIETVPRRGYRFIGELRPVAAVEERKLIPLPSEPSEPDTSVEYAAAGAASPRTFIAWAIVAAVILLIGAVFVSLRFRSTARIASVAVLSFTNELKDPNVDYLCVALPGRIVDALSEVPGLRVASHNSTAAVQKRSGSTRDIASLLNVRAVVLGTVARRGDTLHVTLEAVDTKDDRHLWGAEYKVRESDLPVLEQSIATEIARKLHFQPTLRMAARIHPVGSNTVAYDATLHGEYALEQRANENFRVALRHFQQAINADPDYAPAYVGMAKAYSLLVAYGGMRGSEAFPLAEASVLRALQIDPNLPAAHSQYGFIQMYLHRDLKAAEREFQRSIQLNPNIAETYQGYTVALSRAARHDEAIVNGKRSEELDPLWPLYANVLAQVYVDARRYEDALKLRNERPFLRTNYVLYAQVYALMGQRDDALKELAMLPLNDNTSPLVMCLAAQAYGMVGEKERALQLMHEAIARQETFGGNVTRGCTPYNYAWIYAAVGDRAAMMRMLDEADKQMDMKISWLAVDPVFDAYRSDQDFKEVVRRVMTPR